MPHPRTAISETLDGDVLEIGPGYQAFPTAPGARVRFVDRRVPGGRDATWPELVGAPHGPAGDIDADLDVDGLSAVADASYDVVIASHVIEHVANPIAALAEFWRVLRPRGRLVLLVPDRHHTFDHRREPTPFAHVLEEYRAGVKEVSEAHIREFCTALFGQPPIHPPEVRAWHDPDALDAERFDLHRRRTIHVHVWNPEEFAALITGVIAEGLGSWRLETAYFVEDIREGRQHECGLVLERGTDPDPVAAARTFVRDWVAQVMGTPSRDVARVGRYIDAVRTQVPAAPELMETLADATSSVAKRAYVLQAKLSATERDLASAQAAARAAQAKVAAYQASRTYRVGRAVSVPVRRLRSRLRPRPNKD
jgi:hypothetical protein